MDIKRALTLTGHMQEGELAYLAEAASRSKAIVEIGSWQGRSARALGDNTAGMVFCVDTWRDGGEANFYENLADLLERKIWKVKKPSQEAAALFAQAGLTFDMIFIDADHDYDNIKADILAWRPLLRKGGILCGHDYQPAFTGVMAAVPELVPGFRLVSGSIWTSEQVIGTKTIQSIDFEKNESWLDGPLPVSPTVPSGWTGLEKILPALLNRFKVGRKRALEFGVEYGYSTAVLAQLFGTVTGVDRFTGDEHSGVRPNYLAETQANLTRWPNITLVQQDYRDWIAHDTLQYDLIHVDMLHTYAVTYEAGRWAADHAPVVIFHDTEWLWPEVKEAIVRIAEETGRTFYNYPQCFGLGILA